MKDSRRPPYGVFSLLLQYPDDELLAVRVELEAEISSLPRSRERRCLQAFSEWFGTRGATDLQQTYVETFDLQKRSSLYLTFFSQGDTRQRGQALLRLKRLYAAAGLELQERELPDYLPVVLEFAELAPEALATRVLAEHRAALELLRLHLVEIESPYRHLLEGVCASLPRLGRAELDTVARLLSEGPPAELVGLYP